MNSSRTREWNARRSAVAAGLVAILPVGLAAPAFGQARSRMVYVANNGNLEGSVTSMRVMGDCTLAFVSRVITGSRAALADPCPGCNPNDISLSPNGRYLVTCHPAGSIDGLSVFEVAADGTLALRAQRSLGAVEGGNLDVVWLDNDYFAMTNSDTTPDSIRTYQFVPAGPTIVPLNTYAAGSSTAYLARHATLPILYANDSGAAHLVYIYQIGAGGTLSFIRTEPNGAPFPLELAVSPNGAWVYSAGGISDSGNKVTGFTVNGDGTVTVMAGSPFVSPGASPSNVCVSPDNAVLVAGHGTDATVRTFTLDAAGVPTATGFSFDVGLQGTLGDVQAAGGLLFVTDNSTSIDGITGIYSFTLGSNGSLTQNGPIYSTQGSAPRSVATWIPTNPLLGDMNCDGTVSVADVPLMILALVNPAGYPAAVPCCAITNGDMDGSTTVDGADVEGFVDALIP
ncbi:MAG: hypothetical protein U1A27_01220 [Phycisphaerae bacterium]